MCIVHAIRKQVAACWRSFSQPMPLRIPVGVTVEQPVALVRFTLVRVAEFRFAER